MDPSQEPTNIGRRSVLEQLLKECASKAKSREEFWVEMIRSAGVRRMAEVGVYRGDFAAVVLQECVDLARYYMVDPWRHLDAWNKPSNHDDSTLAEFFRETKTKTEFASAKRVILRGTTTEVVDQIEDGELDLVYVDGDHTLRGIAIDLIRFYPKIRTFGFVAGDDFTRSIWEHKSNFEPTLVFPFAVYFAEAVGATIFALPFSQFCLQKPSSPQFAFVDLTAHYDDLSLRDQLDPGKLFKRMAHERLPLIIRVVSKTKRLLG
jgi:hypothetical protein